MPAARQQSTGGKFGAEFLDRPARLEIAVTVGEPDHAIRVGDIKELRFRPGRIKGDPERILHSFAGKCFRDLRFSVSIAVESLSACHGPNNLRPVVFERPVRGPEVVEIGVRRPQGRCADERPPDRALQRETAVSGHA